MNRTEVKGVRDKKKTGSLGTRFSEPLDEKFHFQDELCTLFNSAQKRAKKLRINLLFDNQLE